MFFYHRLFVFLVIALFLFACGQAKKEPAQPALFELLGAQKTGIRFSNNVKDTKDMNIFNYHNFYNGGGVAIGDINNDGRPDVFFTSNQGSNVLYLNKGNWQFEDITVKANLQSRHQWHTGVQMADVNGDGWLDIYVCNAGIVPADDNSNELYINQQNGTFKEAAKDYGLDDKGLSTQALFFDYDHDGDLDCFVMNNSNRSVDNFGYTAIDRSVRDTKNGDRLYRNEGGTFTDVSVQAGIWGSDIGFGLGIAAGDVNGDGWDDLYVDNDFYERDYLYINQQNGTFKDELNSQVRHTSNGSMGVDMADYNNDGLPDIFTAEMLPEDDYRLKTTIRFDEYDVESVKEGLDFHHQFTSNSLQLNNGDASFSEVAQLAGIDATGWSWSALFFDMDMDGWKDLFVSNGLYRDLTDQDFLEYIQAEKSNNGRAPAAITMESLLDKIPSVAIPNYGFINQKNMLFKKATAALGFGTPSFSSGVAYGDLDGDGDVDLVVNNMNMEAFVYRNKSREQTGQHYLSVQLKGIGANTFGIGAKVWLYTKNGVQMQQQMPVRGFQSSMDPVLHFGLADAAAADSVLVQWPNNRQQVVKNINSDTIVILSQANALQPTVAARARYTPLFEDRTTSLITGNAVHHENDFIDFDKERLIPKLLSTEGPKLAVGDVNGDGREDFFMGSAAGDTAKIFVQQPNGHFVQQAQDAFVKDRYYEDAGAAFLDADGDGDADLIIASGGNEAEPGSYYSFSRLYLNDGKGNFSKNIKGLPAIAINASCVAVHDVNKDGKPDVFIGARSVPGSYGKIPASVLLLNEGNGVFAEATKTAAPALLRLGMVTAAQWFDLDGDGRKELVVAGDWMPITVLQWQNNQLHIKDTIAHSGGWWNCLQVADINGDGKPDLIGGNFGLNSRIKPSVQQPAKLYVSDFDNNGQVDCVPVYFKTDGKAYPYHLKSELQAQLPMLKKEFLHFSDYASKSVDQIFTAEQLKSAQVLEVEQAASCVFINNGKGQFAMQPLPLQAQLSPVFAIQAADFNKDGITDLFLAGNFYGYKPQTGRMDASYGTTFLGNAQHRFSYMPPAQSGLRLNGQARDVVQVQTTSGDAIVVVAVNNGPLKLFDKKK